MTSPASRRFVHLSQSLLNKLNAYALAATAAGVSMLALAEPAEAKIVYTPADIRIPTKWPGLTKLGLDINNDGIRDILFLNISYTHGLRFLAAYPAAWQALNGIVGTSKFESALDSGVSVGSKDKFQKFQARGNRMGSQYCASAQCSTNGPWQNANPKFLGVRFVISNQVHYGWIRVKMNYVYHRVTAVITGYAYETNPNKAILTGKTKGPDVITLPADTQAGTLGGLALGRK